MITLLRLLIISLPFVAYPRLGDAKLSDVFFLAIIIRAYMTGELRLNRYVTGMLLVFTAFTIWGVYRVNFLEHLTILGGWDVGLSSQQLYQFVSLYQVTTYILGGYILARYLVRHGAQLLPFIYNYYIIWSVVMIILFAIPTTRNIFMYAIDPDNNYLRSTFTEKGPFSDYCAFIFTLLITAHQLIEGGRLSTAQRWTLTLVTAVNLGLARGDRSTATIVAFFMLYVFTLPRKHLIKLIPVGMVIVLALVPMVIALISKATLTLLILQHRNGIGRYATMILFPTVFASSPWFGVGFSNYVFYRSSWEYAAYLPLIARDQSAEFYLQMLIEMGLVGATMIIGLAVVSPLGRVFRNRLWKLLPFAGAYAIYLINSVPEFFQMWLWLFMIHSFADSELIKRKRRKMEGLLPSALPAAQEQRIPALEERV